MSHTSKIQNAAIRDVEAMEKAAADLQSEGINCSLVRDAKPRMYYGNQGEKCDYVLKLHDGDYDVGFMLQEDGTYAPHLDTWGGHVGNQIGADVQYCPMPNSEEGRARHAIGKFMQLYNKNMLINTAVQQGHTVENVWLDQTTGEYQVEVGVPV